MAQGLEQVSDQDVIDVLTEHVAHLNYELGGLRNRIQASLKRMDAKYKKGVYRT